MQESHKASKKNPFFVGSYPNISSTSYMKALTKMFIGILKTTPILATGVSLLCSLAAHSQWISNTTATPTGTPLLTYNSGGSTNGRVGIGYTSTSTPPVALLHVKTTTVSGSSVYSGLLEGNVAIGSTFSTTPLSTDYCNVNGGLRMTGSQAAGTFLNASEVFSNGALRLGTNGTSYSWLQSYNTNSTYAPLLFNAQGGGVGIGKTSASATLDILSNQTVGLSLSDKVGLTQIQFGTSFGGTAYGTNIPSGDLVIRANGTGTARMFITNNGGSNVPTSERMVFATGSSGANDVICMRILQNGVVGIGKDLTPNLINLATNGYGLIVSGGIMTEGINVQVTTSANWKDYVFYEDYKLKSLSEVEKYISQHKHLPGIPSEAEVVKEGLDLGKMDAMLLEKIEELTLYMIQHQNESERLEQKMKEIKRKLGQ